MLEKINIIREIIQEIEIIIGQILIPSGTPSLKLAKVCILCVILRILVLQLVKYNTYIVY